MEPQASAVSAQPVADADKKSYLAMLFLAFFAGITGLARVYLGDKVGLVRFYIFIGAVVVLWTFVPGLQIAAGLAMLVLSVWSVVDFFLLYKNFKDASEDELAVTERDKKFAKVFFILYIVGLGLLALGFILALIFGAAAMNNITSNFN